MERPRRLAAEKARQLIAAGVTSGVIDGRNRTGLSPEEEDSLDERLIDGENNVQSDSEDADEWDDIEPSSTSQTWGSYEDNDVEPKVHAFHPERPPGVYLPRRPEGYCTAKDLFQLFFTDDILQAICDNSNTYALVHILEKPTYAAVDGAWSPIDVPELKRLIGLLLMMGFITLPDISRYWSTATMYYGGWARRFLSRNRFKALLAFLHVSDPCTESDSDKLSKLRPLMDHIKCVSSALLQPSQHISVDERMVKSKGRSGIRQYMPLKPVRFGYKVWCLCESQSGYTLDFNIYTGKRVRPGQFGLAYDVVMELMSKYLQQGYKLYFDNFYSSYTLIRRLYDSGVGVCCTTLQTRKGFPCVLKGKQWIRKSKRGALRWVRNGPILTLQWKDTRAVHLCTTMHKGNAFKMVKRNLKDPAGHFRPIMVKKPEAICEYNQQMGGVDLGDQLIQTYNVLMKCHRWWKTLFLHMIDVAVVNSHILFNMWRAEHPEDPRLLRPAGYCQLAFREELVRQLAMITDDEPIPTTENSSKSTSPSIYHTRHLPKHTQRRHNCKVCYVLLGKENRTMWWCRHPSCDIPLCLGPERDCFGEWHSPEFDHLRASILVLCRHLPTEVTPSNSTCRMDTEE